MSDPHHEPAADDSGLSNSEQVSRGIGAQALNGSIARAVRAGAEGQELTASGVFEAIGGIRGIFEAIVPSLVFIVLYVFTQDARLSALVPGAMAVLLVIFRLIQRETVVSALSGMLGVGIAVLITLITGRGVDYFLSGFITNIAWAVVLIGSILVGRPIIGLIAGFIDGDTKKWRIEPRLRRASTWLTVMWLGLFIARLAVQLPMYLSEQVGALGVARIAMGIPLFAIVLIATWFGIRKFRSSSDDSSGENGVISGENTPSK
ncbi:DUF3159 domain-containing protein [Leucobacter denitrificans]|uniref:DUF3159 domain-containing protein n=1 Tax=Leucobacter denitrificans TaxID=683042 RepID=A0A7G9S5N9_9MICO|nr:DUF3159 domain-containing protein [Leucobacter denitrificans]QNN63164.1 DUF3159 domain-containing protein [Leucobacter denitrificans]